MGSMVTAVPCAAVLPVSDDRPGPAAPGTGRRAASPQSRRHPPGPSPFALPGPPALRAKARAWRARQPQSGRVKLGQNFQKSITSFQGANVGSVLAVYGVNVASVLAVEAGCR
jgi:hypothetical protein